MISVLRRRPTIGAMGIFCFLVVNLIGLVLDPCGGGGGGGGVYCWSLFRRVVEMNDVVTLKQKMSAWLGIRGKFLAFCVAKLISKVLCVLNKHSLSSSFYTSIL